MGVKTKRRPKQDAAAEAPALRAFCSRNRISRTALADALGCGRRYVCDVLHADTNGKAVSPSQWERLWAAALNLAREIA